MARLRGGVSRVREACLSPVAIDVETTGDSRSETGDPRLATFVCAAIAPYGIVTYNMPVIHPGSTLIVHSVPYDPVVLRIWNAEWHDTKWLAAMSGELDTTLKGLTVRHLSRLAMPY